MAKKTIGIKFFSSWNKKTISQFSWEMKNFWLHTTCIKKILDWGSKWKKNFAGYRKKCHILIRVVVYGQAKKNFHASAKWTKNCFSLKRLLTSIAIDVGLFWSRIHFFAIISNNVQPNSFSEYDNDNFEFYFFSWWLILQPIDYIKWWSSLA